MLRRRRPPPFGGLVLGLVFLCVSLTPSLVPRGWLVQGLVTGLSTTIGYGLGVLGSHLLRLVLPREPSARAKRVAWRLLTGLGALVAIAAVLAAGRWQQELHLVMGAEDPTQPAYLAVLAVAAVVITGLVALGRGLRLAARAVGMRLRRWVPPRAAALTGATVVALVVAMTVQGVLVRGMLRVADSSFRTINETVAEDLDPPTSPALSGGPGSLLSWEALGTQGRQFIDRAVSAEEVAAFHAAGPADGGAAGAGDTSTEELPEPIRVYAGLDAAEDVRERAELAVAELERAGAFDRAVLNVAAATGRGWVNPTATAALEHLHRGDTATVTLQYSYLPSWLSFLADRDRAAEAGAVLFDAVHERWAALPVEQRPQLVVYGESLGSFATESAFSSPSELGERTDGGLLVGPPAFNPLRRELLRQRETGSPQRLPVVDEGRTVRFAARAADLEHPGGPWPPPRVVYLQHASDPVVWWSPRLAVREPDWLREPRGDDVLEQMRWFPLVTFWQLSADLARADEVPPGHGHDYGTSVLDGWLAVTEPDGWSDDELERLREHLRVRHDP
jgi:uncharacterized membrane protein